MSSVGSGKQVDSDDEKGQQTNFHQKTLLEYSVKETIIFHFHLSSSELKVRMSFSDR